jgi:anti-sigma factor RsiW
MTEGAKIFDLTELKLVKRQSECAAQGNLVEAHALELLIEGYKEKIWTVYWERGEPVFAMSSEIPEEVLRAFREKV